MRMRLTMAAIAGMSVVVAACGGAGGSPSPATSAPPASASAPADGCADVGSLVKTPGLFTVSADNPAFPPWWGGDPAETYPGEPEGAEWEVSDPYSGEGYEAAVAYAVAGELGFAREDVRWVPTAFLQSFAPGPKEFDFYLAQVSYLPERAEAADLSDSYYDVTQAIVALADEDIASVTTIEDLKAYKLGAPVGTTSLKVIEEIIQPDQEPNVYDDLTGGKTALESGEIKGLVVDLPTGFYLRDVELENGAVVGQFATPAGAEQEYLSLVLEKDSGLTACVNEALATLRDDGTLDELAQEWIPEIKGTPFFE